LTLQRGRPSQYANIIPLRSTFDPIDPPSGATKIERRLFAEIVASALPNQFVQSDCYLLLSYVQAVLKVRRLGKTKRTADWALACKVQAMLSIKLRLAPNSRLTGKSLGRKVGKSKPSALDGLDLSDED
jgi:hypothetical protein